MTQAPQICGQLSEKKNSIATVGCREGYKIFFANWKAHGDTYDPNKVNIHSGELILGQLGFHFCVNAIDCLEFDPIDPYCVFAMRGVKYAKVRTTDSSRVIGDHINCVTDQLEIVQEISAIEFFKLCTGPFMGVYENGNKRAECDYLNGQMHGQYRFWSVTGQLLIKNDCVKGQLSGQSIEWNYNGKKIYQCEFFNGKEHGLYRDWWSNGQSRLTCYFSGGTLNGAWKIYYPSGQLEDERHYTMGIY